MRLTLHARLDNVQRVNYKRRDSTGAQAGDGLHEGRRGGRMAVLGHKDRFALEALPLHDYQSQSTSSCDDAGRGEGKCARSEV